MTAKRFEYKNHKVYDNLTGETHSSNMASVNVLNELYKENQFLLHIIDWCLTHHREVEHIVFNSRDEFFIWLKEKGVLE